MGLVSKNHSMKELNWWKVGGEAEFFAAPKSIEELKEVLLWNDKDKQKIWIISGGSNVLVQDGLIRGLVISLHELKGIEKTDVGDHVSVTCLAGTPKAEVARVFLQHKLPPAIFITGIPGDMGGGVVMNAGIGEQRTPREFCEIVKSIEVLRLDTKTVDAIPAENLKWSYRNCEGWQPGIVVRVTVSWPNRPDANVQSEVRAQTKKRITTQPLDLPSCGSTFRNPPGHKAAQLIDQCGLKGFRIGGAQVSSKHANFIVNDQGAKAQDIHKIIAHVKETVQKEKGVSLHPEVAYLGEW